MPRQRKSTLHIAHAHRCTAMALLLDPAVELKPACKLAGLPCLGSRGSLYAHVQGWVVRRGCLGVLELRTLRLLGRMLRQSAHLGPAAAKRCLQGRQHTSAALNTHEECRHKPRVPMNMQPDGLCWNGNKAMMATGIMQQQLLNVQNDSQAQTPAQGRLLQREDNVQQSHALTNKVRCGVTCVAAHAAAL